MYLFYCYSVSIGRVLSKCTPTSRPRYNNESEVIMANKPQPPVSDQEALLDTLLHQEQLENPIGDTPSGHPLHLGNGVLTRELVVLQYKGPVSVGDVNTILDTPHARRVLERSWRSRHLTDEYIRTTYAPRGASAEDEELARASYRLAWRLHTRSCADCLARVLRASKLQAS